MSVSIVQRLIKERRAVDAALIKIRTEVAHLLWDQYHSVFCSKAYAITGRIPPGSDAAISIHNALVVPPNKVLRTITTVPIPIIKEQLLKAMPLFEDLLLDIATQYRATPQEPLESLPLFKNVLQGCLKIQGALDEKFIRKVMEAAGQQENPALRGMLQARQEDALLPKLDDLERSLTQAHESAILTHNKSFISGR